MRRVLLAACAAIALAGGAAQAGPLDDAKSALTAFENGDNPSAIRLFTSAIDSGRLTRSDEELAYVKRAEAYLASSDDKAALADSDRALNLDPRDAEAVATRDRAQNLLTAAPPPTAPAKAEISATAMADYDTAMAKYEAQDDKHQADLAAWRADVQACKAGVLSKCGTVEPTETPPTQTVAVKPPVAPAAAPKAGAPVATATAAPKPAKKEPIRPVIY